MNSIKREVIGRLPAVMQVIIFNTYTFLNNVPVRARLFNGAVCVEDGGQEITLAFPNRLPMYSKGITARLIRLASAYKVFELREYLKSLSLGSPRIVLIDIGANIGEFCMVFDAFVQVPEFVHAFDPDPEVEHALRSNLPKYAKYYPVGLWSEDGELDLHLAGDTADTSLIKPEGRSKNDSVTILVKKFDSLITTSTFADFDLVIAKMDAEGAEPEVLEGMTESLRCIDAFMIDAGPERNGEETVGTVIKLLEEANFRQLGDVSARGCALFVRYK